MIQRFSSSQLSFLFIALVYFISLFFFHRYSYPLAGGDEGGYYAYLPSLLIYHDADNFSLTAKAAQPYCGNVKAEDIFNGAVLPTPAGKLADKYTCGVAILQFPFFCIAYFISIVSGSVADGYSPIFRFFIHLSGLVYPLTGLWFLVKILRKYFHEITTAVVIAALGLATNLYFFSVYNGAMAHSYLFFLYAMLIYFMMKAYEELNWRVAGFVGCCCGLITMIRPNEIICIFIPLLFKISTAKDFINRIKSVIHHRSYFAMALVSFILVILPQLIYWKLTAGQFFYYSYKGESFDFTHPHIPEGLFGWKNGWLPYTPVMAFSLLGIFLPATRRTGFLFPIIVILPVFVYVIYSWWCWNYIDGFGSRPMVELYPLLAFPLAACVESLLHFKVWRALMLILFGFFSWLNIFSTYQYRKINRWSEDANFPYFLAAFGKSDMDMRMLTTYDLDIAQPRHLTYNRTVFEDHFEDSTDEHFVSDSHNGQFAYNMSPDDQYSEADTVSQLVMHLKEGEYLKISFWAKKKIKQRDIYRMVTFNTQFSVDGKDGDWQWIRIDNKLTDSIISLWWCDTGKWYPVSFYIKPPSHLQPRDFIRLFLFNGCKCDEVKIDDVTVEVWK